MSFFTKKERLIIIIGALIGLVIFILVGYLFVQGLNWISNPPELL